MTNQEKEIKSEHQKIKFHVRGDNVNEIAFRRWLVMEIHCGRMTIPQAVNEFQFEHKSPSNIIRAWQKTYHPEIALTLPIMTEKERKKVESLEKHIRTLEKRLEEAQMRGLALDTLIDIAEKQLDITIRKKSGTKQ